MQFHHSTIQQLSNKINIKVCGLTQWEDLAQLEGLGVQYGGIIFYEKSPRFAEGKLEAERIKQFNKIKKVGVFVNAKEDYILQQKEKYGLELAQLHGDETPEFCKRIRQHLRVIKALRITDEQDLEKTRNYKECCDYFLFDAPGKLYGGNGTLFNWEILQKYAGDIPFFLSGGIGLSEVELLKSFLHPSLFAVDVNSRFETTPGIKNMNEIKQFICRLNSN